MRRGVRKTGNWEGSVNNRNTVDTRIMRIGLVGLCLGLALVMITPASAGRQNPDLESRAVADSFGSALVQEWNAARDSSSIRELLGGVREFGPPSDSIQASLVPVFAGIIHDIAGFAEFTQYLTVAQMDDWGTASASTESAFEEGLACTGRDLLRLASGVALVKLGWVQEALPVVEGYAQEGWQYPDTLDTTHTVEDDEDPVTPFYWHTWRETDPVAEDSLNAYMTRVLSYPLEIRRIEAAIFLLRKGIATEQALDAAQEIIEQPQPCSDGDVEYAEQLNLVWALKAYGGARGRAIAAMYRR